MMINNFESERLIYKEICIDDTDNIVRWRSDQMIYEYFKNPEPITLENHINWYKNKYLSDKTRVEYIIIHKQTNTPIGSVGASDISKNTLQIGYLIGEASFQKQGFAVEAINAVINIYNQAGINEFFAEIRKDNIASIKTIEKCGFVYDKDIDEKFVVYVKII